LSYISLGSRNCDQLRKKIFKRCIQQNSKTTVPGISIHYFDNRVQNLGTIFCISNELSLSNAPRSIPLTCVIIQGIISKSYDPIEIQWIQFQYSLLWWQNCTMRPQQTQFLYTTFMGCQGKFVKTGQLTKYSCKKDKYRSLPNHAKNHALCSGH